MDEYLWMFIRGKSEEEIKRVFGAKRLSARFPADLPQWAEAISGKAVLPQVSIGGYSGPVGNQAAANRGALDEEVGRLRRQHATWSEERVNRVAAEKRKHLDKNRMLPSKAVSLYRQADAMVEIINGLVQGGSVSLVLTSRAGGLLVREEMLASRVTRESLLSFPRDVIIDVVRGADRASKPKGSSGRR